MIRVKLLRDQKIPHKAGEIVEVSPAVYNYLISTGSAVAVEAEQKKPTTKKMG